MLQQLHWLSFLKDNMLTNMFCIIFSALSSILSHPLQNQNRNVFLIYQIAWIFSFSGCIIRFISKFEKDFLKTTCYMFDETDPF